MKFFFIAFFAVVFTASARLGETPKEIYRRYGSVVIRTEIATNEWSGDYESKDYNISVTFSNNLSVSEVFLPRNSDSGSPRFLSDEERVQIMEKVAGPGEWEAVQLKDRDGVGMWKNTRSLATAVQTHISRDSLVISTAGYSSQNPKQDAIKKTGGL